MILKIILTLIVLGSTLTAERKPSAKEIQHWIIKYYPEHRLYIKEQGWDAILSKGDTSCKFKYFKTREGGKHGDSRSNKTFDLRNATKVATIIDGMNNTAVRIYASVNGASYSGISGHTHRSTYSTVIIEIKSEHLDRYKKAFTALMDECVGVSVKKNLF